MIRPFSRLALALGGLLLAGAAGAEPLVWGVQVEQLELRAGDGDEIIAWDWDAMIGKDELRLVWRSEAEYATDQASFETLENQLRLARPVSDFFDAVAGIRFDTPEGPIRAHGVLGLQGLAPQWFEVEAELFLSNHPALRLEVEYEALLTNYITLTPSIEFELPFTEDTSYGEGALGPSLEVGARLSFDLVDRAISPYIGLHWERVFAESADLARDEGEDRDSFQVVLGVRLIF